MNSFGQRLKALRREVGVSQSFVADHIGVSTQSVSNWECDNTMPDISQIVPLAALLSVSTDYLLGVGTNEYADKEELESKEKGTEEPRMAFEDPEKTKTPAGTDDEN